jgi:hypothetical protein
VSTIQPAAPGNGPWRFVLFDASDPDDPRWVLLSVTTPSDVRPADVDATGRRYTDWQAVTAWVRAQVGRREVSLIPLDLDRSQLWRVDERRPG